MPTEAVSLATIPMRTTADGAVRFAVHAKPRSRKSRVAGAHLEAVAVELAAPPVDGAANDELLATLAKALRVAKRDVALVGGASSRAKLVEVRGLSESEVRARLAVAVR